MPDKPTLNKTRIDAWDAALTEPQRWMIYDRLRGERWYDVAAWAAKEFKLAAEPSRSALYRFAERMRGMESAHRIESALTARDEAGALVAAATNDDATINAYKAMAQDMALGGCPDAAVKYTKMAIDLAYLQTKRMEIDLKDRAQKTRDDALRLAREKFEAAERRLAAVEGVAGDTALDAAEKERRIKALFGIK